VDQNQEQKTHSTPHRPGESIFIIFVVLGLVGLMPEALALPGVFQGQWAGPGSMPQLLLGVMFALAGGLLIRALRTGSVGLMATVRYLFSRDAVLLLVTVILYAVVLAAVGFEIATFAFLMTTMYLLNPVKPLQKAVIAFATVSVIYAVFALLFEVVLP